MKLMSNIIFGLFAFVALSGCSSQSNENSRGDFVHKQINCDINNPNYEQCAEAQRVESERYQEWMNKQ